MKAARRKFIGSITAVVAVVVIVALILFQPWKLFVDDRVDEAAPANAVTIGPADLTPTTSPPADGTTTSIGPTVGSTTPTTLAPSGGTQFVGIDHGTSGRLLLLADDGGARFVRFEDFETSNGPDLFVYLSTNLVDGDEGAFDDDFVNLGRLDGNIGDQNYEIPTDVDLGRYASVVIWCDRFNSAFGAAPLR